MPYYNPPKTLNDTFRSNFSHILDKITTSYDKFVVCGDQNYDMLGKECNPLSDICTIYGSTNIVKKPTCFKANKGTLLDVILVNKKSLFFDTSVIINAIRYCHALTSTRMRCHVPRMQNKLIEYRSEKHYNKALFLDSVADSNLRSCLTQEDPEHRWRLFIDNFKITIGHHAPIKKRKVRSNQPPHINTRLRKAIWKRKRLLQKVHC